MRGCPTVSEILLRVMHGRTKKKKCLTSNDAICIMQSMAKTKLAKKTETKKTSTKLAEQASADRTRDRMLAEIDRFTKNTKNRSEVLGGLAVAIGRCLRCNEIERFTIVMRSAQEAY